MTDPRVIDLLSQLVDLQRESLELQRLALVKQAKPVRCSQADRELLARLLPAIGGTFGSRGLLSKEILSNRAIAELVAPMETQDVGNLLARAALDGVAIDGYLVTRIKSEGNAALWSVTRGLPEPLAQPTVMSSTAPRRKIQR